MSKKQAVVLIHGIGEQVPMDTLRGFVEAVWTRNPEARFRNVPDTAWSKPDEVSGDYELRRLTTAVNRDGFRTDFFEFYWAHLMEGTTFAHLLAWTRVLLFRSPRRVPGQLQGIWWTLWILAVVIALVGLNEALDLVKIPGWVLGAGAAFSAILGGFLTGLLLNVAGDAARYLHVAPPNIDTRRKIRQAGVELLERLHASGEYERIILAGHSLGTVIGYDILTHLWVRFHHLHVNDETTPVPHPAQDRLEALSRATGTPGWSVEEYQRRQVEYRQELHAQGNPWRVTDFVTMGSPLAHAAVLMARNLEQFADKKAEREFPTCPPTMENIGGVPRFAYEKRCDHGRAKDWTPHHAAVFGPTRWTNLYFPCRHTLWGDVIGGPVAPAFGPGVRDCEVENAMQFGMLSHTLYWSYPRNKDLAISWIHVLRDAMRISEAVDPPPPAAAAEPAAVPAPATPRPGRRRG